MKKIFVLLSTLSILLYSLSSLGGGIQHYTPAKKKQASTPKATPLTLAVAPFNAISALNKTDLIIHGNASKQKVVLHPGTKSSAVFVENSTLTIKPSVFNSRIKVDVYIPSLQQLTATGTSQVTGDHIRGQDLTINASDNSHITLQNMAITDLTVDGHDEANITLGGRANIFSAKMQDNSQLFLQRLTYQLATLRNFNNSLTCINSLQGLNAIAYDQSNIFARNIQGGIKYFAAKGTPLPSIRYIQNKGDFDIHLHYAPYSSVVVPVNEALSDPRNITVENHILSLSNGLFSSRKRIDISLANLQGLRINDETTVTGKAIHGHKTIIEDASKGDITLTEGYLDLRSLDVNHSGHVSLYWINSPSLDLTAMGDSQIHLAGIANTLHARVSDTSVLNAQYLRSEETVVQTTHYALAYVLPTKNLRAFSYDQSNIYTYKWPVNETPVSAQWGNILQMDWRP